MNAPRIHRATPAAGLALALVAASASLTGCGMRLGAHRSDPVARPEEPRLSEPERKIQDAREQSGLDPTGPYWPYRLGQIYLEADSAARAEAALKSSLRRDPTYAPALSLLAKLYYGAGRHHDGVELLEAARARAASSPGGVPPGVIGGLALHYEAMGRHDLASALAGTTARGEAGGSRSALVYVTLRGEQPGAAAEQARAALDDDPRSAVNQNNYGITRLRAGDPRGARNAFLKAIEIDPKLPGPYYNLSILERFYLFDDEAAGRWLKAYRERASEDPDGLFGLAEKGEAKPLAGKESR